MGSENYFISRVFPTEFGIFLLLLKTSGDKRSTEINYQKSCITLLFLGILKIFERRAELITNKPETAKVGAISQAQKA